MAPSAFAKIGIVVLLAHAIGDSVLVTCGLATHVIGIGFLVVCLLFLLCCSYRVLLGWTDQGSDDIALYCILHESVCSMSW
jgi:hypothetical protein